MPCKLKINNVLKMDGKVVLLTDNTMIMAYGVMTLVINCIAIAADHRQKKEAVRRC
jgi:hypothetical protein